MSENRAVKFIFRIVTGRPVIRWFMTLLAPLIFSTIVVLFIVSAYLTDDLLDLPWFLNSISSQITAIIIIGDALFLMLWCVFHFLRARGTPVPFNPPKQIVTNGPYRYSRNPMISGLFILIGGSAFLMHSLSLLSFYLPVFILLNYFELKFIEDPELQRRFGPTYTNYRNRTPMFLPRFFKH